MTFIRFYLEYYLVPLKCSLFGNVTFFLSAIPFKEDITGIVVLMECLLRADGYQFKNVYVDH